MPYLNAKLSTSEPSERTAKIAAVLTDLTVDVLKKKRELIAVAIEFMAPQRWFIGGTSLHEQAISGLYLDIKVTESTNTKDEKSRYVAQLFASMEAIVGTLAPASYVVVQEDVNHLCDRKIPNGAPMLCGYSARRPREFASHGDRSAAARLPNHSERYFGLPVAIAPAIAFYEVTNDNPAIAAGSVRKVFTALFQFAAARCCESGEAETEQRERGGLGQVPRLGPIVENGKQMHVATFGKRMPSMMPIAAEPKAHNPTPEIETGKGPSAILANAPIQKHPKPPTIAPRTLSLRVTGATSRTNDLSRHVPSNAFASSARASGDRRSMTSVKETTAILLFMIGAPVEDYT